MSKSKYDIEVLKNEVFFFDDGRGFRVVDSQMVGKVSRTDREYKVRRLWVTSDDKNMLEIGTQSFNKKSFGKRLDKITTEWIYKKEEWFKEEDDVEFKVDSFEDTVKETVDEWYENWKKKQEIDHLYTATFDGKELAQSNFEHICQLMRESNNMNVLGQTIYNSKEEYFKHWNDFTIERMEKDLQEEEDLEDYEKGSIWNWGFKVAQLNEWRTEFSKKLWDFIESEWENMEERRRNAQKDWRNKMFGEGWEERWERRSFGSQIDTRVNEYDKVFKDLTPREAKRKMRELSKQLHPDLHPELDGTEFTEMHSAYERHISRVA